ncbi:ABC transporter ATP-binding protein/permease [Suilimivivens aceti]|uniref:ABC transporter ATP-binding protein/permease n=1 Tax=Suilimivivens aceti TaxID=2981774 RepID=A0ABT2T3Y9_9FIRM|nr:ABC transporter ATP-binding protein [Suilimivivens aceti]MCU6744955.1 ABC transporter ATP-binding protein/permease [Suilimivivens aceti]SCI00320.1 Putative multidrug export ATP-binding/permease protein SAV1866 [uncultured Clostridium sp.]
MKRYWKYIKPYLPAFICGPLLMIVEVIGEVLLPKFMANIINIGAANQDVPYIITMGIVMVVTALLMMAGGIGGAYFAAKAAISFAADIRKDTFEKVQKFSFANLDQYNTGSLVTRLTNDVTQVQNLINMALRMMLRAPGMLIGALIMAFMMNRELAAVILVVIPILVILIGIVIKTAFPRFTIMQKKLDTLNSTIQEMLTNVRVIKSFVRGDYEEEKFSRANEDLKKSSLSAFNVVILNMPIMMLMMNLTTLGVVWFGGKQILVGRMPVGDLTAFTTYIVQILMSLMMLAIVLLQSSRAMASLHRITEVLDARIDLTDENSAQKDKRVENGTVEFKDVSFRYYKENKEPVLSHINFKIDSGKILGIIGSTGSGKTTLVQMIPRLYDPDEGEVLVDGVNVKEYSLEHLREGVGMVLQKNVLFSGTIRENLMWGDENASEEEVEKAAAAAQAGFVRDFTEGYETELGQGGVNVSGGQKQRLCIARALLKKPKILILDDSTSAVDTATEAKIRESFSGLLKETTKIIIAQRITSVMEADEILVLDEGEIVGKGTHEELLKTCEAYQEIYYSQMDKEASGQ